MNRLKVAEIDWQESPQDKYLFYTVFDNSIVHLRLNDFPEEPICTLIYEDREVNLDELPRSWTLPRHRGESS